MPALTREQMLALRNTGATNVARTELAQLPAIQNINAGIRTSRVITTPSWISRTSQKVKFTARGA